MDLETFLKGLGIGSYDELSADEKLTYQKMQEAVEMRPISPEDLLTYISDLKAAVERDLVPGNSREKNLYLSARLQNYLLIESFLQGPARAKRAMEAQMAGTIAAANSKK